MQIFIENDFFAGTDRYYTNGIQFVPHAGLTLGTVLTLARAGGILRMGHNMTGFGHDTIEPGGSMLQNTRAQRPCRDWRPCEWFGFVGADYRLVGHNIFLDGPVFRDGPSVDHRPRVHDLTAGVSVRAGYSGFPSRACCAPRNSRPPPGVADARASTRSTSGWSSDAGHGKRRNCRTPPRASNRTVRSTPSVSVGNPDSS